MVRTLGVEEELLLFDPATREVVAGAPAVLKQFREHGRGRQEPQASTDELDQELFRHQLETRTDPDTGLDRVLDQLVAARRTAGEAARAADLAVGASGIVPAGAQRPVVTANDRYLAMVDTFGEVARTGGTCGMHVHTAIESEEEGVAVIDRIAPWLPVLLALSANSPYADGRDTGYASWRAQVWSRWPSAGPTEHFGSVERYHEVGRMLMASGAARDAGMLYYDARLSDRHPTVEVRVCDVCSDPELAVAIAGLVRALVETTAREWAAGQEHRPWRSEALRAAHWRASRYGVAGSLVDPRSGELAPATEVLAALVDRVRAALVEADDLERVLAVLERAVRDNGATRQRAAFERTGEVAGVVDDLIARTESSWQPADLA